MIDKKSNTRFVSTLFGLSLFLLITTCGTMAQSGAQTREPSRRIIEIRTYGRDFLARGGMKLLFFRLMSDRVFEYDSRTAKGTYRKRGRIDKKEMEKINTLLSDPELKEIRSSYNSIVSLRDEVYLIELDVVLKNIDRHTVIKNYMPTHPQAESAYPPSLIKLLDAIQQIRPTSAYERKNNLILNLPY